MKHCLRGVAYAFPASAAVFSAVLSLGCSGGGAVPVNDGGATDGGTTSNEAGMSDTAAPPTVTFTELYTNLLGTTCTNSTANCHTSADVLSSLDMSTQMAAYTNLVGVTTAGEYCAGQDDPATAVPWKRVIAGNPAESLMYVKVQNPVDGGATLCGYQMPPNVTTYKTTNAEVPAPLMAAQMAMIYNWIEEGALNN